MRFADCRSPRTGKPRQAPRGQISGFVRSRPGNLGGILGPSEPCDHRSDRRASSWKRVFTDAACGTDTTESTRRLRDLADTHIEPGWLRRLQPTKRQRRRSECRRRSRFATRDASTVQLHRGCTSNTDCSRSLAQRLRWCLPDWRPIGDTGVPFDLSPAFHELLFRWGGQSSRPLPLVLVARVTGVWR